MGVKRKNQPGYVKSKGKDGRIIWVPETKARKTGNADISQIKSDFSPSEQQDSHEEIREELFDAYEDYNDAYKKRYPHLEGSHYSDKGYFSARMDIITSQEKRGMNLDDDKWNHDARILSEMMQILSQDVITENDREAVRELHSQLYPFKARRDPGIISSDDKYNPGNQRIAIHGTADELLEEANSYPNSQEFLNARLQEIVQRSNRMINAGGSFEELYDMEDIGYKNIGMTHYYGKGTKPYLNAAINYIFEHNRRDLVEEYGDRYSSFMDPFQKAVSSLAIDQNLYLSAVFPEKYLAKRLEQYDIDGVFVSPFRNGREYGNVYTVLEPDGSPVSFAVYQHRNSDSIIINGKRFWDGEELPYAADSKEAFFAEFEPDDYDQAADALSMYMKDAQQGELPSEHYLVDTVQRRDWNAILAESLGGTYMRFLEEHSPEEAQRIKRNSDNDILDRLDFDPEFWE